VEGEALRFVEASRRIDPAARSRSYPGFDATGLTTHAAEILAAGAHVIRTRTVPEGKPAGPPPGTAPADWLDAARDEFVGLARDADPAAEVPTYPFGDVRPLAWVYRSAVTELALHRWDLESAGLGAPAPIATDLAVDLVDAVFEWWAPTLLAGRRAGLYLGGTVALHATDADVRWLVTVADGHLVGRRADPAETADATLSGPADRVVVALWKRLQPDADGLTVEGDRALVQRLLRIGYIPDPQTTAAH
jgi:hypothetical protein